MDQPHPTASEWAQVANRSWLANRVDVIRGYGQRLDLVTLAIRISLVFLMVYSVYLAYCESCKEEYSALLRMLLQSVRDAATGSRGSVSGAAVVLILCVWLATVLWMRIQPEVLLVDFKTYRHAGAGGEPSASAGEPVTYERFMAESKAARHLDDSECFTQRSLDFQEKILRTSCIGEATIFPPSIFRETVGQDGKDAERVSLCMSGARQESELMMFHAIESVLKSTRTRPEDIGILVVNCSLFCPTPSLSAMIVNHFKLRADVLSYNLGGMGCSAGVIAIDLAKRLLRGRDQRNTLALVVSTENITQNWYRGNDRSMLLSNCLFRCGAAAVLLSNRRADRSRSRFRLLHTVRTHMGKDEPAYRAVYEEEDEEGIRGVRLSKEIMEVAGGALKRNITHLGPLVLPISEQVRFFLNLLARKALRGQIPLPRPLRNAVAAAARTLVRLPLISALVGYKPRGAEPAAEGEKKAEAAQSNGAAAHDDDAAAKRAAAVLAKEVPPYLPDFTKAVDWFCVHTGGRAVIDAIEKNLSLPSHCLEPSRLSLYRYGNVSSASIWYELELISLYGNMCGAEREGGALPPDGTARRIRRGDLVWQIAFGSGFKCNSAVWQALRAQ